jgi:hypothetical protein
MRSFPQIHAEASALPGFDGEAFAAMVAVPAETPRADRAGAYSALARHNAAAAEELMVTAASLSAAGGRTLIAAGLAGAARLRLLAAELCRNLAGPPAKPAGRVTTP